MDADTLEDALAQRFLRYSAIATQSDAGCDVVPSSSGQWELACLLERELREAGASDVHLSDTAVLTARIPATMAGVPAIGWCTHLDTADAGLNPQVHARIVDYDGGDLLQGYDTDGTPRRITLSEHPELQRYAGQRILISDGTSVLGADDKAGIAVVMELATRILAADHGIGADPDDRHEPEGHGEIVLSFVPDEEIGLRGVRTMDLSRFTVDWAYTIDSCEIGEVVEETFNAATVTVTITGVSAHPMSAYGVMVNPTLIATQFIGRLDPRQTPEWTRGREGYTWVHDIHGDQSTCTFVLSVRDHEVQRYRQRLDELRHLSEQIAREYPRARITMDIDEVYANIAQARHADNAHALAHVYEALQRWQISPIPLAMRGGTDGSWLSTQGIMTPNVFTGAHNFHSAAEFLPLPSFAASYRVCHELVRLAAGHPPREH